MALQLVVPSGEPRGLSTDIMIPYSLDRWVLPGLFVSYLIESIGPDFEGCSFLFVQLFSMFGAKVSVSSPCTYGTCFRWSPMRLGGNGYSGHVGYHG